MMKLHCIIVDDEPVARDGMAENVREVDYLHLAGTAENAVKASRLLETVSVDLMFLDIRMPKLSGLDFLRTLKQPPMVILTTAHPSYALEGFDMDVLDYLVKPISFERFLKACSKAREFYSLKNAAGKKAGEAGYIFIKCDSRYEKIVLDEILFIKAADNFVILHTLRKKYVAYLTFKGIEESLPSDQFIKVHKSYIVSLSKIEALDSEELKIGTHTIPISRSLKDNLMETVVLKNLVRR